MAVLMGVAYSAVFGPLGSVLMLPLAGATGALGFVAVVTLLTAGSPVGAGTTMTLHGSLFNVGAAVGGALGGLALAMAGYSGLAVVLPIFGVSSALLAWWPGQQGEH
jgi:predicted MFS family arabinose efflux permease